MSKQKPNSGSLSNTAAAFLKKPFLTQCSSTVATVRNSKKFLEVLLLLRVYLTLYLPKTAH